MREQAHSDDWKAQYDAVNVLRQLSKFNHELLISHLSKFGEFLKVQIDNLRSNLIKNALLFIIEFFSIPIVNEQ